MAAILRMIVVLSLLCGLSGFVLSYLRMSTATRIEEQVLVNVQGPALATVFPNAENSPIAERHRFELPGGAAVMVFPALEKGRLVGVALENFAQGYGGDVGIMVGFDPKDDRVVAIGVTTMKETPGLGTRIADTSFRKQFVGQGQPVALRSEGGSIDAISGSTVSSVGAVNAVKKAAQDYLALKDDILKLWAAK